METATCVKHFTLILVSLLIIPNPGCNEELEGESPIASILNVLTVTANSIVFADLSGEYYFVLRDNNGRRLYTKRGETQIDAQGKVVTPDGYFVQGYPVDEAFNIDGSHVEDIAVPVGTLTVKQATTRLVFGGYLSLGDTPQGASLAPVPVQVYDAGGAPVDLVVTMTLTTVSSTTAVWKLSVSYSQAAEEIGSEVYAFDNETGLMRGDPKFSAVLASSQQIRFDLNAITGDVTRITTFYLASSDGYPLGTLASFAVQSGGTVVGTFDNTVEQTLAQFAVTQISNPETLVSEGGGVFSAGPGTTGPGILPPVSP